MRRDAERRHAVDEIQPVTIRLVFEGHFSDQLYQVVLRRCEARAEIDIFKNVIRQRQVEGFAPESTPAEYGGFRWRMNMKISSLCVALRFSSDCERLKPQLHVQSMNGTDLIEGRSEIAKPIARRIVVACPAPEPACILTGR